MLCVICKYGEVKPGQTTATFERDGAVIVLKDVPADVCDTCSEYYLAEDVTARVMRQVDNAFRRDVEIEVAKYAT
jgi:YgiT-type zinc finger domain-containing protein